jgi:hypothetical protein
MPQDGRVSEGPHSATSWVNMIGVPAVVVPAGFDASGLPFGLEFSARPWRDGDLLAIGYAWKQATGLRKPPTLVERGLLAIAPAREARPTSPMAAGLRGRRLQQRHRCAGRAVEGRGSRLESRGRPLLGDPLAAIDDGERVRAAHLGPAHRRDPRGRHPGAPQRDEPGARLVLRAGRPPRSPRREAAAARGSDGPPDRVRDRTRGRALARLPAQHEGELDLRWG